ncbi:MAG: methyltransferase domain-containing protein [bacterium]
MEFTGERYVPGIVGLDKIYVEHMSRYLYASAVAYGRRVLDLGCGCGYGSHFLVMQGALRVIGVDRDPEAIDFARRNYKHPLLSFEVMDVRNLNLTPSFDLITCFELIEHIDEPEKVLDSAKTLLEKDGLFLISTPNRVTYRAGGEGGQNPFHFKEYNLAEFEDLLRAFFPEVVVLGQCWVEAIVLDPIEDLENVKLVASLLPERYGAPTERDIKPEYFFAICGLEEIPRSVVSNIRSVVVDPYSRRYWEIKQAESELRQEFDKRGKWANRLDEEIRRKDQIIARLKSEVESLQIQFQSKENDTARLKAKIEELEERVKALDRDVEHIGSL